MAGLAEGAADGPRSGSWRPDPGGLFGRPGAPPVTETTLGLTLAFVAGAVNAGGFMLAGRYTSHMSGIVSAVADDLVLGATGLVLAGLVALAAFMGGAACSAVLINWGRRNRRHNPYTLPLRLEAALLLAAGLAGGALPPAAPATLAVPLLCFLMGLQNATITKISNARIRTTHVTGLVTDIGIELGKLFYWNTPLPDPQPSRVRADRGKLRLLAALLGSFTIGGVAGALAFGHAGFPACLPLALALFLLGRANVLSSPFLAAPAPPLPEAEQPLATAARPFSRAPRPAMRHRSNARIRR